MKKETKEPLMYGFLRSERERLLRKLDNKGSKKDPILRQNLKVRLTLLNNLLERWDE